MLTQKEIQDMRSMYDLLFTSSLTVKRALNTSDGAGGITTASTVVGTYSCHVRPDLRSASTSGLIVGQSEHLRQLYIVITEYDADIQVDDILQTSYGDLEIIELQIDGGFNLATRLIATVKEQ